MLIRIVDFCLAALGLMVFGLPLLVLMLLVYLQDRHSPFYLGVRAARGGGSFQMIKLRSMVIRADKMGASSTAADDQRITRLGHFIRRLKLDELPQLINVLKGEMSFVGPRPQVLPAVETYTMAERVLLTVRPGITDMASIVFADEGEILKGSKNPDADYDRLIRPWKSELALLYVKNQSLGLYIRIIILTALTIVKREVALLEVSRLASKLKAPPVLVEVASRKRELVNVA